VQHHTEGMVGVVENLFLFPAVKKEFSKIR